MASQEDDKMTGIETGATEVPQSVVGGQGVLPIATPFSTPQAFMPPQQQQQMGGPPAGFPMQPFPGPPGMPPMLGPLAPGWSEHRAPDGVTPYYYNAQTKQSTYTRPSLPPPMAFPPFMPPQHFPPPQQQQLPPPEQKKKKEKPKEKIPIPGTTWTKIITTENNVFYTEKESKRSSWVVPEEIKEEVAAYEEGVKEEAREKIREEKRKQEEARAEAVRERERRKVEAEEEGERKKKAEKEHKLAMDKERERKRKEREDADGGGSDEDSRPTKTAKLEAGEDEEAGEEWAGPEDEEDEEAWQKAVAAEIAAEHAVKDTAKKEAKAARKEEKEEAERAVFATPQKVELSVEEGRALFRALLQEKDISPFAPWDSSLPLFINDPRYILLSSLKDRQEVFEEYCRDTARARRSGKASALQGAAGVAKEGEKDPEKEYKELLKAEVRSTRMLWEEFRRVWRKDRRFWGWGKDDKIRERAFRTHLKELGERKRADAKRAEIDFNDLLSEQPNLTAQSVWKDVKRPLISDPRYDAVNSSSLREELFNAFLSRLASSSAVPVEDEQVRKARERKERGEASLRERERKVQASMGQANRELERTRQGAGREEGEREFGSLLVQAVRDHDSQWLDVAPQLSKDPRFNHPALSPFDKSRLFQSHIASLTAKRFSALHALFATHAPLLSTPFTSVFPEIHSDFSVTRLSLTPTSLEAAYDSWQRTRAHKAQAEFRELMGENSFVEFWGRMRKKVVVEKEEDGKGLAEREDEDEEMGEGAEGGGRADLGKMAESVDLEEMHKVLRHDARYIIFDHIPEQREEWMKDYLDNLDAAQSTIHHG